jgi:hypothetical protein
MERRAKEVPPNFVTLHKPVETGNSHRFRPTFADAITEPHHHHAHSARKSRAPADPNAAPPSAAKLLASLARLPTDGVRWEDACLIAGMLHGNGYFYAGKRYLIDTGLVTEIDETAAATREGLKVAGGKGVAPTRNDVLQLWRGRVKPHAGAMLDAIARAPEWLTTKQIQAATGIRPGNGHWYSGIAAIRDPGLIVQDRDRFRLSDFVRGLP